MSTTGTDCGQGQGRPHAALHLVGASADASVSHRNLAADEPARRKRSGRGDDDGVRARAGDANPGHLRTAESGDVSGTTRATGGDSERAWQSWHAAVGHSDGRRPIGSACGRAYRRGSVRLSGLLVWISAEAQQHHAAVTLRATLVTKKAASLRGRHPRILQPHQPSWLMRWWRTALQTPSSCA